MTIHTSRITTQSDGDLSIDPNGTGEVKLTKLAGNGEVPLSVNTEGEVGPLDNRDLPPIDSPGGTDIISIQRGADHFAVNAEEFVGGGVAEITVDNISWSPTTPAGSGTLADPFVLTPATVATPGGEAESVEKMELSGLRSGAQVVISEEGGTAGVRFEQGNKFSDGGGSVTPFSFKYKDTPASTIGAAYEGLLRVGSQVYVKWTVTQVANNTTFTPADQPTASPTSVDYPADGKFGTVDGVWADGSRTLVADNLVFSVNNGALDGTDKFVTDGTFITVGFVDSVIAAASEGDTITGSLVSTDGAFLLPLSFVKDTTPAPYFFSSAANVALNTESSTSLITVPGFNAPTVLNAVGSGAAQLTNLQVRINGGSKVAASGVLVNPGDTIQIFGTTGNSANTSYGASISLGGVVAAWSVTTVANVVDPEIGQPVITSPVNGSTGLVPTVTVESSSYVGLNGAGGHSSSTWEIYEADARSIVSPSISNSDDGNATPLILSGTSPAGLSGTVVMVDSATPSSSGGIVTPANYTITSSTIQSVSTDDYSAELTVGNTSYNPSGGTAGGFLDIHPGTDGFDGDISLSNKTENANAYIYFQPAGGITVNSSLVIYSRYTDSEHRINGAVQSYIVQGGQIGANDIYKKIFTFQGTISILAIKSLGSQQSSGFSAIEVDGKILLDGQPQLTFQSGNPDLQYFRVGDIVQSSSNAEILSIDQPNNKMTVSTGNWLGSDGSTSGLTGLTTTGVNTGVQTSQFDFKLWDPNNQTSTQDELIFDYVRPKNGDDSSPQTYYTLASQTDGTTRGWSVSIPSSSVDGVNKVSPALLFFGYGGSGANDGINRVTQWTIEPGQRYNIGIKFEFNNPYWQIVVTITQGGVTVGKYAGNVDPNSMSSYMPSLGTITFGANNASGVSPNQASTFFVGNVKRKRNNGTTDNFTLSSGTPTAGGTFVSYPTTARGVVAATGGNSVTLSSVEGRWIGSGSENKAGTAFFVSTAQLSGAPDAPTGAGGPGFTPVTPASTGLTSATLTDAQLDTSKFYYSRVKYSDGSTTSPFSAYNQFGTSNSFVPDIGGEYAGGYFAGQINDGGTIYNLVVSPKSAEFVEGASNVSGVSTFWNNSDRSGQGASDQLYGGTLMSNASTANSTTMMGWVRADARGPNAGTYDPSNTTGTGVGGFNDWYIPALKELRMLYYYFKPTSTQNDTGKGGVAEAIPALPVYTAGIPQQTFFSRYRTGGSEAFDGSGKRYVTATQVNANDEYAISFANGDEQIVSKSSGTFNARCVRREAA